MINKEIKIDWPLIGNQNIKDFFTRSLAKGKLKGAYIFTGPDNLGKTSFAIFLAQVLLCANKDKSKILPCGICPSCKNFKAYNQSKSSKYLKDESSELVVHADFTLIKKLTDKKNISIEQIRELSKILSYSSFNNSYKIAIIKHAENLSLEAANALLKTIEEPRENVIVILVTSQIEKIVSTIHSRCQVLRFNSATNSELYDFLANDIKIKRGEAKEFAWLAQGRPALAIKFIENKDFLNTYIERLTTVINLLSYPSLNKKFNLSEVILYSKESQENSASLERAIEIWQGVLRDLYLYKLGQKDLVVNQIKREDIAKLNEKHTFQNIIDQLNIIEKSKDMLAANISSKLVLDYININI